MHIILDTTLKSGPLSVSKEVYSSSDDRLGRTLDSCFNYGCTRLFSTIASKATLKFNVNNKFQHLDSTSMQVEGVHLLIKRTQEGIYEIILNLNSIRRHILQVLGPPFQKLYANAA